MSSAIDAIKDMVNPDPMQPRGPKRRSSDLPRSASDLNMGNDDDNILIRIYDKTTDFVKIFCCGKNSFCCQKKRKRAGIHNVGTSENGEKVEGVELQVDGKVANAFEDDAEKSAHRCIRDFDISLRNFNFGRFCKFLIPMMTLLYVTLHFMGIDMIAEVKLGVQELCCCVNTPAQMADHRRTNKEVLDEAGEDLAEIEGKDLEHNMGGKIHKGDLGYVAPGTVVEIEDADQFREIVHAHEQVIVKFYATWCGPCKRSVQPLRDLADKHRHWTFLSIDVEGKKTKSIAKKFGIKQMPTFKFIHHTKIMHTLTGFSEKKIVDYLSKHDNENNEKAEEKIEHEEVKEFTGQKEQVGIAHTKKEIAEHEKAKKEIHHRKHPEQLVEEVHTVERMVEIVKEHPQVVAKFYATWCGPCKKSAKPYEELAKQCKERLNDPHRGKHEKPWKFVTINIDQSPELSEHFEIQSMPTFKFFSHEHTLRHKTDYDDEYDEMVGWDEYALKEKLGLTKVLSAVDEADLTKVDGRVLEVADVEEFADILEGNDNVVVKFYADWCGPCRASAKPFDAMAKKSMDHPDPSKKYKFIKVNVDRAQLITSEIGVQSMPTFKFYHKGEEFPEETVGWDEFSIKKKLALMPNQYKAAGQAVDTEKFSGEDKKEHENGLKEDQLHADEASVVSVNSVEEMDNYLKNNPRVIAKFYADWCGPCRNSELPFEEFAKRSHKLKGIDKDFKFLKINVDTASALTKKYKVRSMPTFIFFSNTMGKIGMEYDRVTGWSQNKIENKLALKEGERFVHESQNGNKADGKKADSNTDSKKSNFNTGIKTIAEFEEILKSNNKVVAKFHAKWCPPCRASKAPVHEIARNKKDWTFIEVDVDECDKELKKKYGIRSLPTFKFFAEKGLDSWDAMMGWDERKFIGKFKTVEDRMTTDTKHDNINKNQNDTSNPDNFSPNSVADEDDEDEKFKTDESQKKNPNGPNCADKEIKIGEEKQWQHDSQAKRKCEGGVCKMAYNDDKPAAPVANALDALGAADDEDGEDLFQ